MKTLGTWWNSNEIEVVEIEGKAIALYGWNGEVFTDAFEVAEECNGKYYEKVDDRKYTVRPIYTLDENNDGELIGYELY